MGFSYIKYLSQTLTRALTNSTTYIYNTLSNNLPVLPNQPINVDPYSKYQNLHKVTLPLGTPQHVNTTVKVGNYCSLRD